MLYVQRNKLNRNRLKITVTMIISMHVGLFMYGHSRYSFPFKRLVTCVCTLAHEWTPKACWVFQNKLFTYIGLLTSRSSVWKLLTCGYPPPLPIQACLIFVLCASVTSTIHLSYHVLSYSCKECFFQEFVWNIKACMCSYTCMHITFKHIARVVKRVGVCFRATRECRKM